MKQINNLVEELSKQGRYGDTMLAHINPAEAEILRSMGGSGTINPKTGLPEYWGWNPFRAVAEIFSPVLDPVSDFIGTGGGDQGILNTFDEGIQSVGSGFAELDDFVNEEIPGGWYTVGALAVGGALLGPELLAAEGAGFTGATETGLATLAGEGAAADLAGTTILGEAGLTGAAESGIGEAFTSPIVDAPISQYELSPKFDLSPNVPIESVSSEFDPTGSLYTPEPAPYYDASPFSPVEQVSPELDPTGSLAKAGGISTMDVLRGVNLAKGLLGSSQEQAAAPATQFRGTRIPQGQVDYSGILSLLQMQSPQRRSLLG